MEGTNILTGDLESLKEYREFLRVSADTRTSFDAVAQEQKTLERELATAQKNLKDLKESTIKKRRSEVSAEFDSALNKESGKLKKAQNERGKAKAAGVKDRITNETSELTAQNNELKRTISKELKAEKLPNICGTTYYFAMYLTKGAKEVFTVILSAIIAFLVIPGIIGTALYFCVPVFQTLNIVFFYSIVVVIAVLLCLLIYILFGNHTKHKHLEKLREIRTYRDSINENKAQIKKIAGSIRGDSNEEMYNLGEYDSRISTTESEISSIEAEKEAALKKFDEVTAPSLMKEMDDREMPHIEELNAKLAESKTKYEALERSVKENNMRLSTEYEAYLGKDYSTISRVDELIAVMQNGEATTVGEAINFRKTKESV